VPGVAGGRADGRPWDVPGFAGGAPAGLRGTCRESPWDAPAVCAPCPTARSPPRLMARARACPPHRTGRAPPTPLTTWRTRPAPLLRSCFSDAPAPACPRSRCCFVGRARACPFRFVGRARACPFRFVGRARACPFRFVGRARALPVPLRRACPRPASSASSGVPAPCQFRFVGRARACQFRFVGRARALPVPLRRTRPRPARSRFRGRARTALTSAVPGSAPASRPS
jgi:hypothetical protein